MERAFLKAILENIIFVADTPVAIDGLTGIFEGEATKEEIREAVVELQEEYEDRDLLLTEVAEGWRFQTRPEYAEWITKFFKMERGSRLGRAALEALAIAAYRQPITRAEVDEIRGVDSGGALRGLVEKGLVKSMGRRKTPGRPMMYGTTKRFLEYFGLARLADLPTMDEFAQELAEALPGDDTQETFSFPEKEIGSAVSLVETDDENDDVVDDDFNEELDGDSEEELENEGAEETNESEYDPAN